MNTWCDGSFRQALRVEGGNGECQVCREWDMVLPGDVLRMHVSDSDDVPANVSEAEATT